MLNGEFTYSSNSMTELEQHRSSLSYQPDVCRKQLDWNYRKSIAEPELEPENNIILIPKLQISKIL
jgi:hypothetical protein